MYVLLGHSRYLMGNCIGFISFLEFCCQCKKWKREFSCLLISSWNLALPCPPLEVAQSAPLVVVQGLQGDNYCTWRGHVELVLKTCRGLPFIIFYDIGLFWGKRFGPRWLHFLRYNGVFYHCLLLWRVCSFLHIICHLGKYMGSLLNCDHLGVSDVDRCRLGCWVLQVMGPLMLRDDDTFWEIIVGEWSIMWEKFNAIWVSLSSCFGDIDVMAPIMVHWETELPSLYSMGCPSFSNSWIFINNHLCTRRG